MIDHLAIKKIKDKLDKDEYKIKKSLVEIEKIWEDTGLKPNDPTYLVEKTMRFEMAHENIIKVFSLFNEIISDYKKLCLELEKHNDE
jgi:hypothetical protein